MFALRSPAAVGAGVRAVRQGIDDLQIAELNSTSGPHRASLWAVMDAMEVGRPDGYPAPELARAASAHDDPVHGDHTSRRDHRVDMRVASARHLPG